MLTISLYTRGRHLAPLPDVFRPEFSSNSKYRNSSVRLHYANGLLHVCRQQVIHLAMASFSVLTTWRGRKRPRRGNAQRYAMPENSSLSDQPERRQTDSLAARAFSINSPIDSAGVGYLEPHQPLCTQDDFQRKRNEPHGRIRARKQRTNNRFGQNTGAVPAVHWPVEPIDQHHELGQRRDHLPMA